MSDGSVIIDTELNNGPFEKGLNGLKNTASNVMKVIGASSLAVGTAFGKVAIDSIKARGEIEQSIGGVETLFKENADKVIENAKNAYKTAGVSANDYMQGVTSFSASLLQSTAGDTAKASDIADMAFRDMSDNANKMGTDMASIQNAYQGFAKQNYTMLDNLKLGYGGTKSEMERLLQDAQKLTGVKYDINNLSDVYEAIHVIQEDLEITGTTAKEAEKTLTGSFTMLQASIQNFLSGSGGLGEVTEALSTFIQNLLRIAGEAVPYIVEELEKSLPKLFDEGGKLLDEIINGIVKLMPSLVKVGVQIIIKLANGLAQALPEIISAVIECIGAIGTTIYENWDLIVESGKAIISAIIQGFIDSFSSIEEKVQEMIGIIGENLQPVNDFISEHQDLLTILAGIVGTLTTAIIAYNIAQNASAIAIGIVNVATGLASGVMGIYTTATTIATAVSTAFGAVMAFLTSPITLVILAIGALITIIVLLVRHWDEVKEMALKVWDSIKEAVGNAVEKIKTKFNEMKEKIINTFNNIINGVKEWINEMKSKAVEGVKNVTTAIYNKFNELPNKIREVGSNIAKGLWNGIESLKDWVVERVRSMGTAIINKLKEVLGIASPSKVFAEIGKYTIQGFGEGFIDNSKKVFNDLANAVEEETADLSGRMGINSSIDRNIILSNTLDTIENDRNLNVQSNTILDGKVLATTVNKINVRNRFAQGLA